MTALCGAQLELAPGKYATCYRPADQHRALEHLDGTGEEPVKWPACSQHCLKDHVHGRYRLKLGQQTGPKSMAARAPKPDPPKRGGRVLCKVCFEPGELEHGQCKDRKACAERAPQLGLGI